MKNIDQVFRFCFLLAFTFMYFSPTASSQDACVVDIAVNQSSDDAEESGDGSGNVSLTSTDLEMTYDGSRVYQTVGIRFNNVQIPNGATINSAYIQFTAERVNIDVTELTIHGENADNAPTFSADDFNVSTRAKTVASANWNVPAWNTIGDAGADQRTADIASVIEEVVGRTGWNTGNSIALIITGAEKRVAVAYDGSASEAPVLHIEYSCDDDPDACDDEDPTTEDVIDIDGNCLHFKKVCDDGDPQTRDYFDDDGNCVSELIVCDDLCPNDPEKTEPGECGCGNLDADLDGDGVIDCEMDECPNDPDKTEPGECGCGNPDTDTDGDGTPDCNDWCPDDPNKTEDGECGCGNPEPGTSCDDDDDCTINDIITDDCECRGTLKDTPECRGETCPEDPGTSCDDGDPCTTDDQITDDCECKGTPIDTDGDGTPDCDDPCPEDPNDFCEECPADLEGCENEVTFIACDKVVVCTGEKINQIVVDLGPTGFQHFSTDPKFTAIHDTHWEYTAPVGETIQGIWVKTKGYCDKCGDEDAFSCVDCEGAPCPRGNGGGRYYKNTGDDCTENSQIPTINRIDLNLYPNPTTQQLFVKFKNKLRQRGRVQVLNTNGDRIYDLDIDEWAEENLSIDLGNSPHGLYFLRVIFDDGTVLTRQFVLAQ